MQTVEKELDSNSQCLDVRNEDLLLELRKEGLLYPKFHFLPAILESLHPVWTSAHVLMKLCVEGDEVMVSLMAAGT